MGTYWGFLGGLIQGSCSLPSSAGGWQQQRLVDPGAALHTSWRCPVCCPAPPAGAVCCPAVPAVPQHQLLREQSCPAHLRGLCGALSAHSLFPRCFIFLGDLRAASGPVSAAVQLSSDEVDAGVLVHTSKLTWQALTGPVFPIKRRC